MGGIKNKKIIDCGVQSVAVVPWRQLLFLQRRELLDFVKSLPAYSLGLNTK